MTLSGSAMSSVRCALAAVFLMQAAGSAFAQTSATTLYKRVGGYDVIAAIALDFTKGLGGDPVLKPYFFPRADDSRRRILQMFRELLCSDAGGPCIYVGRDMKTAHAGIKMGEPEWGALMKLWGEVLDRHNLAAQEKVEMVQIFAKYKKDMIPSAN